jgi:hypothetical protein
VIDGKAAVLVGDRKVEIGKGREVVLTANLKPEKFDRKREDDLYAWSNVRSEYNAAASYQAAKNVTINNYGGWSGLGFGGWYGPGWYWNSGFNSWAWLPMDGAFYSPFGFGFYGPGVLPYAPVVVAPVYAGGGGYVKGKGTTDPPSAKAKAVPVPISPRNPPAMGAAARSPYANQMARTQAARSFANNGGFRTASGAPAGTFAGGRVSGGGVRMGGSSAASARSSGSGWSRGSAPSAGSYAGSGGHMSGGAASPSHK